MDQEKKHIQHNTNKKYIIPAMFVLILIVMLTFGVSIMRTSLMKLTIEERTNQLEEMVTQIQTNLDNGLQIHWNLMSGIINSITGETVNNDISIYDNISHLENDFCTDMYGCRIMLLDEQGVAYLSDGCAGVWYDLSHLLDENRRHTFVSETDTIDGRYLVFSQELESKIILGREEVSITHIVLLKDIKTMKQYYTTKTYGGNAATYIIKKNGTLAYFDANSDDVIGARNVFKALNEAEYVQGLNFAMIKEQMDKNGIAAANVRIKNKEYYYCLTTLKDYDMILMLLIPADSVAISTMNMMNSTIKALTFFISIISFLIILTFISLIKVKRSSSQVRLEQETNRELNHLRLVAESANEAKSTFLSNMSHDIRTPMNAIIGFTNIAMKQNPTDEIKNCLSKIRDSSEHLLSLINDVLDISRIESGKINYEPTSVDITEITKSVLSIMYGYLSNRNIEFNTYIEEPKHPYVLTDAVKVREILVNILGNAVKFTGDGGSVDFSVSYFDGSDERKITACYRVKDTGIGMSEEFVEHIFEDFSQEEHGARTQYKGTGLGLSITKKYIDLMGGTISVESMKGVGSTFTVELPMEISDSADVKLIDYSEASVDLDGLNILLAEDNDLNAEIAMVQLEELGMKIIRAVDGEDTIRIFTENPPKTFDIILMDVMMPNKNGYEATKVIRTLKERPDGAVIPIIAMTANAFAEDVQASMDAGMNGHLSKPIVIEEVKRVIQHNL